MIAWAPKHSNHLLSGILLKAPLTEPLTPEWYRSILGSRIQRLVDAEEPEYALGILAHLEKLEPMDLENNLKSAGDVIVENSNLLQEVTTFLDRTLPASEVRHDPEILDDLEEQTLVAWVDVLLDAAG